MAEGKTPTGAGIAAMAGFVANVLVESAGEALSPGLQVAKAGRALRRLPALQSLQGYY